MARQLLFLTVGTLLTAFIHLTHASPGYSFRAEDYSSEFIIKRDFVILGGGSSGTYAAIALRDQKKTVAVIEKNDYLGGHTNTYKDPASGKAVDYGVVVFDNTDTVKSYFGRFNIPVTLFNFNAVTGGPKPYYIDFRTGKAVAGYVPKDPSAALGAYAAQLAKYPYLSAPGYNLPNPVPADLLIPFGEFVKKYNLDDAVFILNELSQGYGNFLEIPALYVLNYNNLNVIQGFQSGYLVTVRRNNGELYQKAAQELGDDLFLSSTVLATLRTDRGVYLVIKTPKGIKLVIANKLIISAPPLLSNLAGFDLSAQEQSLFKQWVNGAYYASLVTDTGIPDTVDITNVGADTAYNLPVVPAAYGIDPTLVPGLKNVNFGAAQPLGSDDAVKSAILATIQRVKQNGGIPNTTASSPKFAAYSSHTPYELRVSTDAIKNGFYTQLNALQGAKGKSTYYTGAAFDKHDSGDLWAFTAGLVKQILAA